MNTKRKIDEVKVLAPVRAAMRGWYRCNYTDLDKRVRAAYAVLGQLVLNRKLQHGGEIYRKAYREIQALEDRLTVLSPYNPEEEHSAWFARLISSQDPAAPVQLAA